MSLPHRLSNHFSCCRLISLAKLPLAMEYLTRDTHGPYIIGQKGYDPADLRRRTCEFLLGRSGGWIATHWFVRMPVDERRKEFLFANVVEVMELMETLTSKVQVIRSKPEDIEEECPDDDVVQKSMSETP